IMFAEQGATVIVAEMNEQAGKETVKQITEAGQQAFFYQTDISDEENVRQLVETVHEKYGKIDILFNNAGIGFSARSKYKMASVLETPLEDWNSILGINLNGVYLMSKYVLPIMIKQNKG